MSKQLLMYEKVAPLNKVSHQDWSLKASNDYGFARELNSVPLTAAEFPLAAPEYAIVFTGNDQAVMPAVIMGVNSRENLYIDEQLGWKARYVPAFIRRYPFVFSANEDQSQLVLCIDESFKGFNTEGRGERLFDNDGEQTQYLGHILSFLEDYQTHFQHTQLFCRKLVELDLLKPMTATVKTADGSTRNVTGFLGVDRDKLKALAPETLAELAGNDWLELIYVHLHSIRSFGLTMDRIMAVANGADGASADEAATDQSA